MRGGFGRHCYERPQPSLQVHSYEDVFYPPRAYRYHIQQAAAPATPRNASHGGVNGGAGAQATSIVLPTIDADATCGPFLKGSVGGTSAVGAERRPPPRLRYFYDCFVTDDDGQDVQSLSEVCRHAEPLNPFHYRELWNGMDGEIGGTDAGAVKSDSVKIEDKNLLNGRGVDGSDVSKSEAHTVNRDEKAAKLTASTRSTTRAAQKALQRTLRALGLTDELSSMVLLAARVPPGGCLTRKQEKLLRLRHQRRPAPPRPIRRGAKVFMPVYAVLAGGSAGEEANGLADVPCTAATGGLIDVTAAGPRVLRVKNAAAHQLGAFGAVGSGLTEYSSGGPNAQVGSWPTAVSALPSDFAFDADDEDEKSVQVRGGYRAGGKRGRGDDEGLEEGDIPLIASGRWSALGVPGGGGGGTNEAAGGDGVAVGQLDEEAEEDADGEDDLSTGMAEDDDDDANFSSDGGNDNDSFSGGGDDGNDDYEMT